RASQSVCLRSLTVRLPGRLRLVEDALDHEPSDPARDGPLDGVPDPRAEGPDAERRQDREPGPEEARLAVVDERERLGPAAVDVPGGDPAGPPHDRRAARPTR